jgi:hypothetical protein
MSQNMLGDALREYSGLRHQLDENLLGENGVEWSEQLKRFLRKENTWAKAEVVAEEAPAEPSTPESILELVNNAIVVPTSTERFVACDRFVRDISDEAKVKISYLGDNFKAWFLKGKGKIEEPFAGSTLCSRKLLRNSVDGPIIRELGGEQKAESFLTEVFSLMEKQSKGQKGVLLNNGWWNIFYIRDLKEVLRTVYVDWRDDGWHVRANSVENPVAWDADRLVFSRNSELNPSATSAPAQA